MIGVIATAVSGREKMAQALQTLPCPAAILLGLHS
jgi:hypothetical protein